MPGGDRSQFFYQLTTADARHHNVRQNVVIDVADTDGFPQFAIKCRHLPGRGRDARRLAHRFLGGITSQRFKGGVDLFDDAFTVRNHDGIGGLLDRAGKLAQ